MIEKFSTYDKVFRRNENKITGEKIIKMVFDEFKKFPFSTKTAKVLDYLNENFTGWVTMEHTGVEEEDPAIGRFVPYMPYHIDEFRVYKHVISYDSLFIGNENSFMIQCTIDQKSTPRSKGRKTHSFKPQKIQLWFGSGNMNLDDNLLIIRLEDADKDEINIKYKKVDPYSEEDWSDTWTEM